MLTPVINSENGEVFAVMEFLREGLVITIHVISYKVCIQDLDQCFSTGGS